MIIMMIILLILYIMYVYVYIYIDKRSTRLVLVCVKWVIHGDTLAFNHIPTGMHIGHHLARNLAPHSY